MSSATFAAACTQMGGVKDGARCFYLADQNTTWDNAWQACAASGGTLAQIHTLNEYNNIINYVRPVRPLFAYTRKALMTLLYVEHHTFWDNVRVGCRPT